MPSSKRRLLINFGYHRKGWIYPFESLGSDFELVYLYYIHPSEEPASYTEHRVIYWSDFSSANDLLDDVQPDKVLFMDISSGLGISLNLAARNRNILTYIVQHGLFSSYRDYLNRIKLTAQHFKKESKKEFAPKEQGEYTFSTLSFFWNSISIFKLYQVFWFPIYYALMAKLGPLRASKLIKFKARLPDFYLVYTDLNALLHKEIDRPKEKQIIPFGNPEFDRFLNQEIVQPEERDYYLLIDQPFADNRFGEHIVSRDEKNEFILKLNTFCISMNKRLLIKLHPESYDSDWLVLHDNIEYVKEHEDLYGLINRAVGCFGFFSTLMIPAAYLRPVVLFRVTFSVFAENMDTLNMSQVLDYHDFEIDQIDFSPRKNRDFEGFKNDYLFKDDGKSLSRLRKALK